MTCIYLITKVDRRESESVLRTFNIFFAIQFLWIHVIGEHIQLRSQLSVHVLTVTTHFNSILSKFLSIPIPFRFFCHDNERNSFGFKICEMNRIELRIEFKLNPAVQVCNEPVTGIDSQTNINDYA